MQQSCTICKRLPARDHLDSMCGDCYKDRLEALVKQRSAMLRALATVDADIRGMSARLYGFDTNKMTKQPCTCGKTFIDWTSFCLHVSEASANGDTSHRPCEPARKTQVASEPTKSSNASAPRKVAFDVSNLG